jgi:hypothetical protein
LERAQEAERAARRCAFQISLKGTTDALLPPIDGCRVRIMPGARFLAQLV